MDIVVDVKYNIRHGIYFSIRITELRSSLLQIQLFIDHFYCPKSYLCSEWKWSEILLQVINSLSTKY